MDAIVTRRTDQGEIRYQAHVRRKGSQLNRLLRSRGAPSMSGAERKTLSLALLGDTHSDSPRGGQLAETV